MITILKIMFSWPNGIVVGNLIASAICWTGGLIHLHRVHKRRHEELKELIKKHGKLSE